MKVIENARLAVEVERKHPLFIDVFLYPTSISGIIHLVLFLLVPVLIRLLDRFIFGYVFPYGIVIFVVLYVLFIGYVLYYLGYCVFDSSKGNLRAPDINAQPIPDWSDCFTQIAFMLGCTAICFWPAAVYYIFTERADWLFWLLAGGGTFFFPMSFLRGVMFDALDALNPKLIVGSIFRTFLPYCSLVLVICVLGGIAVVIKTVLPQSLVFFFASRGLCFYLAMVAMHLLGQFYWWHKDKLNWGI